MGLDMYLRCKRSLSLYIQKDVDTDYDESYFQDLEHTVKIIDTALSLPKEWGIEYQSSW